jgi:hypothetical protein
VIIDAIADGKQALTVALQFMALKETRKKHARTEENSITTLFNAIYSTQIARINAVKNPLHNKIYSEHLKLLGLLATTRNMRTLIVIFIFLFTSAHGQKAKAKVTLHQS